ncbi:hypothetical protein WCLP8_410016 [uncultured Gammaproteobacteria bacterium]
MATNRAGFLNPGLAFYPIDRGGCRPRPTAQRHGGGALARRGAGGAPDHQGNAVRLLSANIAISEGEYAWTGTVEIAAQVNETTENIGARRLHTVLEKLLCSSHYLRLLG